jgi:hypothetical protein
MRPRFRDPNQSRASTNEAQSGPLGRKKRVVAEHRNGFKYVVHSNLLRGSFVPKVAMSFEKTKKSLVRRMTKKSGKTIVVEFKNDDVPTFLRNLDEFEKVSKKCRVMVK